MHEGNRIVFVVQVFFYRGRERILIKILEWMEEFYFQSVCVYKILEKEKIDISPEVTK